MMLSIGVDEKLKFEIYLKFTNFFLYVATWGIFQEIKVMETNRSFQTTLIIGLLLVFNGYRS